MKRLLKTILVMGLMFRGAYLGLQTVNDFRDFPRQQRLAAYGIVLVGRGRVTGQFQIVRPLARAPWVYRIGIDFRIL